ncbi:hypothetical protein COCSUDRAFT_52114 [Coccomyxa subellipsoidea C-169]|uniref:P-loop containing nucleoside triphosphate hydrolase protein n=1 Tax=Coccomyxa subellipsoidea (strain C-169) TaxID=574566 RepID=I0Z9E3_COCSC|nr:hypothetical protein COCSUDRAFT_52114 [Coccomyxa subellipsoidea C-169]EIE27262.1 hypothetical protein COCSUDRAFT_52114 [Coccomyxa subellipsoidea C-169]|eukprot:XP_005651806.1 hypothetical protein COCSUDRAFT_52114 [Coccomyxa subellipsoidea C-169]
MTESWKPVLILMKGHPGSGKSTVARCLSELTRICIIDKDDARDCLTSLQSFADTTKVNLNALSYGIMWRYAQTQLLCRNSVIIDCPLARIELFEEAKCMAEQASAILIVVECLASDVAVWQSRLEARASIEADTNKLHKPNSWADLQALLERYNGCDKWNGTTDIENYISIDTTTGQSPQEVSAGLVNTLASKGLVQLSRDAGRRM